MKNGLAAFFAVIASIALLAAIVIGGWQAGWWFKTQNTNREARLYQHQYGHQNALREEISNKFAVIQDITVQLTYSGISKDQKSALQSQRLAIGNIICRDAAQVDSGDSLPADQQDWVSVNCEDGTVSANSDLRN